MRMLTWRTRWQHWSCISIEYFLLSLLHYSYCISSCRVHVIPSYVLYLLSSSAQLRGPSIYQFGRVTSFRHSCYLSCVRPIHSVDVSCNMLQQTNMFIVISKVIMMRNALLMSRVSSLQFFFSVHSLPKNTLGRVIKLRSSLRFTCQKLLASTYVRCICPRCLCFRENIQLVLFGISTRYCLVNSC